MEECTSLEGKEEGERRGEEDRGRKGNALRREGGREGRMVTRG